MLGSILPRIEIWTNSFIAWLDRPFFGSGLGGFEFAYAPHRADHMTVFPNMTTVLVSMGVHAGAAHNELLQGLVEIGLIGVLIAGWFIYRTLRNAGSERYAVYAVLAICLIEFPLQNPATAILAAVALALCSRTRRSA